VGVQTVNKANPDRRLEVDESASVSILVSRDQALPYGVVLDVFADTRRAGSHYLGALTIDTQDTQDPASRPAIVGGVAWIPGATGYLVRLAQVEPKSGSPAPQNADVALDIDIAAGPPATRPGLRPHVDNRMRVQDRARGAGPFQLAMVGPRKLVSFAAAFDRGTVDPATQLYMLFYDLRFDDAALAGGEVTRYLPLPLVDKTLVFLGSDDIDDSPVLAFSRGLRAVISSSPDQFVAVDGSATARVDGWTRA
jgi:hypothetical protein